MVVFVGFYGFIRANFNTASSKRVGFLITNGYVNANSRFLLDVADIEANVFNFYKPDAVMHLAAESHVDRSITNPLEFVYTNVIGTVNLLNLAFVCSDISYITGTSMSVMNVAKLKPNTIVQARGPQNATLSPPK